MTIWQTFGLGLTLGFIAGVALRDAWDLYRAEKTERADREHMPHRAGQRRLTLFGISALVFVLAINAGLAALLIFVRLKTEEYAQCTADWQQQFSVAYLARTTSAGQVSDALDGVITAVAKEDREGFAEAVQNYVKIREEQEKAREANPLPPLPAVLCGPTGGP